MKVLKAASARARLRGPRRNDRAKISVTTNTRSNMEASSVWNGSPELQAAAGRWQAAAHALEANGVKIRDLQGQLGVAQAQQRSYRRAWEVASQHVLAVVTTIAHGDADLVHEMGFDVQTRTTVPVVAPDGVASVSGPDVGEATWSWSCASARNGYVVQTASDASDARTHSQLIPCTRTKITVRDLASRSNVHLRVAAIDPASTSGLGPWSAWVIGTAR